MLVMSMKSLCVTCAYVLLHNYSIDFDQTAVKSRSVYSL